MAVRTQGTAIIADLPAGAVAAIFGALGTQILHKAITLPHDPHADETTVLIRNLSQQQGYLMKHWHLAADEVVSVRLIPPGWDAAFSALERYEPESREVTEALEEVRTAILTRDGLLAPDGTIDLPDMI